MVGNVQGRSVAMVGVVDDLTTLPPVSVPSGLEAGRLRRG